MKGDALAKALEAQPWDPSVKSLVNFPDVLAMMSEKLDWTQKLGDAFLAQEKDVLATVQKLRAKAQASGSLKTTKEQVVKTDKEVIIIQPANPQVIYVPTYNPTVVYGTWAYPAYPPYPVYPPGYVATTAAFSFAAGAAVGAAWGYAWGHSDWHGGDVNVNVNRNATVNNNINRTKYQQQYQAKGGSGQWQHDPSHRGGVAYRDQNTAKKYNRAASNDAVKSREAYRGKGGQGAGVSTQPAGAGNRQQGAGNRQAAADRGQAGGQGRGGASGPSTMQSGGRQGAFGGMEKGSNARMESNRGQSSRQSMASAQPAQRGGGGGLSGGGRSGGGGGGLSGSGGGGRGGGGGGRGGRR
ncbi:MAG: hypothetical protein H6Q52_1051 [Deltaproteobacteria bacterium]|nr:hypothetical protein [Deltaproteobacteria bacterium]